MQITDIRVRKIQGDGKMRGMASITIDDEFVVHDIKIIDGEKGFFIAMPSRRSKEGEFRDVAHPIKSETRTQLQNMILKAYEEAPDAAPGEAEEA